MIKVFLHGYAARYGDVFDLAVSNPKEAVHALSMQIPGFSDMIREGEWHVLRGPLDREDDYDEETLEVGLGDAREMHILPAIRGAGNGGLSVVLGVALIVAATFMTGGMALGFFAAGAGMLVGGLIQMTMKLPGTDTNTEDADNKASFLFSGPRNQSTQGVAIPRGYGRMWTGSVVVSAGIYAEELTS